MGCSYETAKQTTQTKDTSSLNLQASSLNARIKSCNKNSKKQFQSTNSKPNQHLIKTYSNDNCQFKIVQQQQQAFANIDTTAKTTNHTAKTSTAKVNHFQNQNTSSIEITGKRENNRIKYTNRSNYTVQQETINFGRSEGNNVTALQKSCINCYPLACHNRFCCEQQHKQQPHLALDEIANHTRQILKPSTCIKVNNSKSYSNCSSCNNYCRCHLSLLYPKHTKNTLRNEQPNEPQTWHCNCVATPTSVSTTSTNAHSANDHCLPKTFSHARTSLTANVLDIKNNLKAVMANCATVANSLAAIDTLFIKNCLNNGIGNISSISSSSSSINSDNSNKINTNINSKNNYNKSEPYRGYSQRKSYSSNKNNYSSYTSSSAITNSSDSIASTCFLHDAIRSNRRCNNNNHDMNNTSNTISYNENENKTEGVKDCSKTCTTNNHYCRASTAHAAAFNFIGQNYYSFLRNTINFYTASSVILVLCYLTSTTSAATTKSDTTSIDKHPILGIDWSKFDESSSDKEILDLLLEKKRYDKRLLPPVNGTLTVNVNVLLLSLASPDESSLKYEVEFLLNQQWNDPRLQYGNKSHYDFLNALHHHDSIWTPDTYFIMHGDFKDPIIPMHFALRIYRNGTITYAMRRHLILSCQGSLHIFPFDDPKCSFSMESISYEEAQIKYIWKNDEDTLRKSPSLTTLNAYLIKNQTTACDQNSWRGNYSCLRVDLIFTRDRAFYFTTVFIPGIILVTSSFITFWLEWNAVPARSMIGVTTMLNFFTTSNGFRSTLPVVSNLTAMNVWDGVCMCFIYASLLEFVCVNYMGRKRPQHNVVYRPGENPVTQRLPAVLSRIGVILASPLEIIEREFHAALSSEKAAAGLSSTGTSLGVTPTTATPHSEPMTRVHFYQEPSGGIIATAVENLRSRSLKRRSNVRQSQDFTAKETSSHVYEHVYTEPGGVTTFAAVPSITTTTVTIEGDEGDNIEEPPKLRRTQSMSTNTPPLISKSEIQTDINGDTKPKTAPTRSNDNNEQMPVKPPRKKTSRSTSPSTQYAALEREMAEMIEMTSTSSIGEKKRDAGGPNEIVACTTCGGSSGSPCTHSANNGCATETCFVQVRKKEPPHPIRIAKTIDVIARITFPTAYAIFLIFFFVHYKAFS